MQDERVGLRFAALIFVAIAAFLAVMTVVAYWQFNQIVHLAAQSDVTGLDWSQLWLVPVLLGAGTVVVLAIAVGFWRAASNVASSQQYVSSTAYQTPGPSVAYQSVSQNSGGLDPNALMAIKEQLAQDRTINAIKLYRKATGVGLKEARDAVLLIQAEM